MLFNSTKAGADKLNRSAMRKRVSPDCTMYFWGTPVVVEAPTVVEDMSLGIVDCEEEDPPPPSVNNPERIARKAKMPVLHTR